MDENTTVVLMTGLWLLFLGTVFLGAVIWTTKTDSVPRRNDVDRPPIWTWKKTTTTTKYPKKPGKDET